jgi:hypothetical protein
MNCENCKSLLRDLVENKLGEHAAQRVTSHLASCQSCETEFENLFAEESIYPNFLSAIKVPEDLPASFQARLESEVQSPVRMAGPALGIYERLTEFFVLLRRNAALTTASVLLLFAVVFVFFTFVNDREIAEKNQPPPENTFSPELIMPAEKEPGPEKLAALNAPAGTKKPDLNVRPESFPTTRAIVRKVKPERETPAEVIAINTEEKDRVARIQGLETEAARQLEKVELLFRAFRNAGLVEETGQYDIEYEKQQARKLLRTNVELKRRAEIYGTLLTEKMLNEVEPYLLDIANLDSGSSTVQVTEIKARFRSQHVIASLQGY